MCYKCPPASLLGHCRAMDNTVRWVIAIALVVSVVSSAEDNSFEGCLRRDSISCVQLHVYRKLRALFGQDNINLLGGFQLVKTEQARSLEDNTIDEKMFGETADVSERQTALEDFAYQRISNLFNERMFSWGLTPALDQVASTARMAVTSIPQDLRDRLSTYVVEGRGKKKVLKSLIPILIMAKMKMVSMLGLAYVIISVIAKKALVASTIALAITLFISIKKLLAKHHSPVYYEIHTDPHVHSAPVSHPDRSGWAPAWSGSGWDSYDPHGAHSSHSQHLAYSPQKPALR